MDNKSIGDRLKLLRSDLELNARKFAMSLNIDPSQYNRIESGNSSLSAERLRDIASKYNVNTNWILTGEGEMFSNTEASIVSEGNLTEYLLTSTIKRLEEEVREMKSKIEELEKTKKDK